MVMDRAVKDMKQYGMSPTEFTILEVLYTKGRIPLQQIGGKILITSGSITYNIDKLEKKGHLKRVPSKDDRRVIYTEITEAGNELFSHIFPDHAANIHSLMISLSLDEKQDAIQLLKKLGKGVQAR
jgi:MarR family 2-MHQ and catechol resistance regulon transcriptional repressor